MRKNYLWYQFFRHPVVGAGLRIFYSRYTTSGREKLPADKPLLFVPNHQNSFMDAFLVVCKTKRVMHFLTRAQAFNPPILGWFIRSLNMLPVYRVRDGFSSIQKNNFIFQKCIQYLKNLDDVLVFPEANHNLKRRIRPLSKGFTRIAFGAEVENNWQMDLQVVPVGVNYSKHRECRNPVHIEFGDPIPVKQFEELYKENENAATQQLKKITETSMKKLVMHIPNLEHYAFYKIVLDDLEEDRHKIVQPELMNERISLLQKHVTDELAAKAKSLDELAERHHTELSHFAIGKKFKTSDLLMLPIYLISFINNIIPFQAVRFLTTKVIKDHAFDISIKFLAGIFLLPVFYLFVSSILLLFGAATKFTLIYFLISLLTAPFFIRAKFLFLPLTSTRLKKAKPPVYEKIRSGIQEFIELRNSVLFE